MFAPRGSMFAPRGCIRVGLTLLGGGFQKNTLDFFWKLHLLNEYSYFLKWLCTDIGPFCSRATLTHMNAHLIDAISSKKSKVFFRNPPPSNVSAPVAVS